MVDCTHSLSHIHNRPCIRNPYDALSHRWVISWRKSYIVSNLNNWYYGSVDCGYIWWFGNESFMVFYSSISLHFLLVFVVIIDKFVSHLVLDKFQSFQALHYLLHENIVLIFMAQCVILTSMILKLGDCIVHWTLFLIHFIVIQLKPLKLRTEIRKEK